VIELHFQIPAVICWERNNNNKKKIRKHHLLKFFLTKLYFNGPFNAQMDKGITSVIELYQTLSQRPSLKTLQEKWLSIIFSADQHSVCLESVCVWWGKSEMR